MRLSFVSVASLVPVLALAMGRPAPQPKGVVIHLQGQLWQRPLGRDSQLKFRLLGSAQVIDATLSGKKDGGLDTYSMKIESPELMATATFLLVPATAKAPSYVVTQVRVYNGDSKVLIAECSNFDGLTNGSIGVGACSGVLGDGQFGLTLSQAQP